ncbi:metal-dependent transcriptional regulator [Natronobacterium gregoryi]|uniref:Iron dependent repressor n=2 Tax=Natronobacterium gregoryi TaxID=44930 RepID=L0AD45_NATGS|nr:metal-dependent transcriptional regulator [Natronobacterium gregoryi]AFZ71823.1 Mn-dependent transcriptional regulator [Natronobacterium gregoryi SP2]ELY73003.1 iron dependent repressor [Natronobacterium gregoryi SP2]PLK19144.1 metal-dependent transcriptional regulator [Natronobacterium gregoryi SP2]SFJ60598.1 iron (metal) dependent repressor, DtxR family [Natronobacterium gregoryi]
MNTADQYLKAIYLAQRIEEGPASTGTLADLLEVSPASVNEMIGKLEDRELVEHEKYKGASLTDEGLERAHDALQTYCIIERFLANVLEVEEFRAEARALESVIDDTVAERLDTIIDRPQKCPECFDPERDCCERLETEISGRAD